MKKLNKEQKGITMVALVITIIVLLILAGITIAQLSNSGLFDKSKQAKEEYQSAQDYEETEIAKMTNAINSKVDGNRDTITMDRDELIALIREYSNPVGTILAYSASKTDAELEKSRLLKCEGQAVSRTDFAELFAVIGENYGAGDGSTTFNIPDLRGEFLRGTGSNGYSNQGDGLAVGMHQDEGLPNISGTVGDMPSQSVSGAFTKNNGTWKVATGNGASAFGTLSFNASSSNNLYGNSSHVTPTNTSVLYCIKY